MKFLVLIIFFISIDSMEILGEKINSIIHILIWDNPGLIPELSQNVGQNYFTLKYCSYINCFVTSNHNNINLKEIDVILFNAITLNATNVSIPSTRLKRQKYVFMNNKPVCKAPIPSHYNDFFNLTWTYRLDSDALWRFFLVTDKNDEVIGPARNMQWIDFDDMEPISETTQVLLQSKKKAAAWYPLQCKSQSKREEYVEELKAELEKYTLTIDIFGPCGNLTKSIKKDPFYEIIESDYYFYLAFESIICEDYVTEDLLTATNHLAVPIVYGGADYNRFLPRGSYLNAKVLDPKELAKVMNDTIHDVNRYYDFFKWQRYYNVRAEGDSPETDEICGFCSYLNEISREFLYKRRVYTNITEFWSSK